MCILNVFLADDRDPIIYEHFAKMICRDKSSEVRLSFSERNLSRSRQKLSATFVCYYVPTTCLCTTAGPTHSCGVHVRHSRHPTPLAQPDFGHERRCESLRVVGAFV